MDITSERVSTLRALFTTSASAPENHAPRVMIADQHAELENSTRNVCVVPGELYHNPSRLHSLKIYDRSLSGVEFYDFNNHISPRLPRDSTPAYEHFLDILYRCNYINIGIHSVLASHARFPAKSHRTSFPLATLSINRQSICLLFWCCSYSEIASTFLISFFVLDNGTGKPLNRIPLNAR